MRHGTAGGRSRTWGVVLAVAGLVALGASPAAADEPDARQATFTSAAAPLVYHHGTQPEYTLDVQVRQGDSETDAPVTDGAVTVTRTPLVQGEPAGPAELVATLQLDPAGQASMSLATLGVGDHRFDIEYPGDEVFAPSATWRYVSVSAPLVPPGPDPGEDTRPTPALSWSVTPSAPVEGGPITLTVTVAGTDGTPTGEIEVGTVDTNDHYSKHTLTAGQASAVLTLPAGTQQLHIGYLGDTTYRPTSNWPGYTSITVLPRSGEVVLDAPRALTAAVGSPTTFTVAVTSPWDLPSELLVEVDGVLVAKPAVPSSGVVTVTVPGQAPGTHTVTLRVAATTDHPAVSSTTTLTVAAATAPERATEQPTGEIQASTGQVLPGGEITVTASGYLPGEVVAFYLHSDPIFLGTAVADAAGVATLTVNLPANAPAGAHHVRGIGGTSGVWAEVPVTLTAAGTDAAPGTGGATGTAGTLAVTGTGALTGVGVAAAMLLLGTGMVVLRRLDARRTA